MAERIGPQARPEEIGQQLLVAVETRIRSQRPRWQPGAVDFLRACRSAAIPTGLVTAAWRSLVNASLERMRIDIGTEPFDVVVTGDTVTAGKPHAEPYETAAGAIGVATRDCLAVEDSPTGVQSALAAGCVVVAVPQGVRIDGSSVLIVESLENRQPQDLWRDARRHLRLDA
jgi:HAD superfamily hydrolase (TIGR01509 family)